MSRGGAGVLVAPADASASSLLTSTTEKGDNMADELAELRRAAAKVEEWTRRRDELMAAARAAGVPVRTVAEAARVSHQTVENRIRARQR